MKFHSEICEPKISEWKNELVQNSSALVNVGQPWTADLRKQLREVALREARIFTREIEDLAFTLSGKNISVQEERNSSVSQIIATGHQPIIYHNGIIYKNLTLNRFLQANLGVTGLNINIDTDTADAGHISLIQKEANNLRRLSFHIATQQVPLFRAKIASTEEVDKTFNEMSKTLSESLGIKGIAQLSEYAQYYKSASGIEAVKANIAIRRIFEGVPEYMELPLTRLALVGEIKNFVRMLVVDYQRLHSVYNSTLNDYRNEKGIKNLANPFPNLTLENGEYELPFWFISTETGEKVSIYVKAQADSVTIRLGEKSHNVPNLVHFLERLPEYQILVTKAALSTVIFRLGLSDLFIHGIGGAKYDEFTDQFISNYFSISAPKFCTASASYYLLEDEVEKYERTKQVSLERRDMKFHLEKYIDNPRFSDGDRTKISGLILEKKSLIDQIKKGQGAGESTATPTKRIKAIEKEMSDMLDVIFGPTAEFREPPKAYLDLIYFREAPYFLRSRD